MENAKKIALIERYFRNELEEEELKYFQEQLETDTEFAKAVALENEIVDAIQLQGNDRFRQRLEKIHQETINDTKIKPLIPRKWLVAASVAIILGLSLFLLNRSTSTNSQQLFTDNYQKPLLETTRTGQSASTLQAIKLAYDAGDYTTSINQLNGLLAEKYDGKLALVLGANYLESNQLDKALTVFENIHRQTDLDDDAFWYIGLTYLKMGNSSAARAQFETLLNGSIPITAKRTAKVEQILEQLRE